MARIDAHHHLWQYSPEEYGWIDETMALLRRDFLVDDLLRVAQTVGIEGAVTVQARQSLEETNWLLEIAGRSEFVRGVVGWVPLVSSELPRVLDELKDHTKLRGVRHVVQDEPDPEFLWRSDFNRGITILREYGLTYDILIFERQLSTAIRFVDQHPNQIFVLDHGGKPCIRNNSLQPWQDQISDLARRENVYCKISGLVTEANWKTWSEQELAPFIDTLLRAFGPQRLMVGSDWPVCLVAASYQNWFETLSHLLSRLSEDETQSIMGGTALKAYRIPARAEVSQ